MDIFTHMVAGGLAGGCAALMIRGAPARLMVAVGWGALGGFLPDIDAVSRVPGFDATLGRLFGLQPGGIVYTGSEWYSHHHFTHSLAAALGAALLVAGLMGLERMVLGAGHDNARAVKILMGPVALMAGYLAHLAGDLVTPASAWGGVQLLWPLDTMVGGWGWCWWFNNYDIFLVQLAGLALMGLASLAPRTRPVLARVLPAMVLAVSILGAVILLQLRQHDYAYSGEAPDYWALEEASLREQQRLLPPDLYGLLTSLDAVMPLPF